MAKHGLSHRNKTEIAKFRLKDGKFEFSNHKTEITDTGMKEMHQHVHHRKKKGLKLVEDRGPIL
jgi:hypothetical protein